MAQSKRRKGKKTSNTKINNKSSEDSFVGRRIAKSFGDDIYYGTVIDYDSKSKFWKIEYDDGDSEELEWKELSLGMDLFDGNVPPAEKTKRTEENELSAKSEHEGVDETLESRKNDVYEANEGEENSVNVTAVENHNMKEPEKICLKTTPDLKSPLKQSEDTPETTAPNPEKLKFGLVKENISDHTDTSSVPRNEALPTQPIKSSTTVKVPSMGKMEGTKVGLTPRNTAPTKSLSGRKRSRKVVRVFSVGDMVEVSKPFGRVVQLLRSEGQGEWLVTFEKKDLPDEVMVEERFRKVVVAAKDLESSSAPKEFDASSKSIANSRNKLEKPDKVDDDCTGVLKEADKLKTAEAINVQQPISKIGGDGSQLEIGKILPTQKPKLLPMAPTLVGESESLHASNAKNVAEGLETQTNLQAVSTTTDIIVKGVLPNSSGGDKKRNEIEALETPIQPSKRVKTSNGRQRDEKDTEHVFSRNPCRIPGGKTCHPSEYPNYDKGEGSFVSLMERLSNRNYAMRSHCLDARDAAYATYKHGDNIKNTICWHSETNLNNHGGDDAIVDGCHLDLIDATNGASKLTGVNLHSAIDQAKSRLESDGEVFGVQCLFVNGAQWSGSSLKPDEIVTAINKCRDSIQCISLVECLITGSVLEAIASCTKLRGIIVENLEQLVVDSDEVADKMNEDMATDGKFAKVLRSCTDLRWVMVVAHQTLAHLFGEESWNALRSESTCPNLEVLWLDNPRHTSNRVNATRGNHDTIRQSLTSRSSKIKLCMINPDENAESSYVIGDNERDKLNGRLRTKQEKESLQLWRRVLTFG